MFSGNLSETATPTIVVKNAGGSTVRTLTGGGVTNLASMSWNGRNGSNDVVAEGTYTAYLSLEDLVCNTVTDIANKVIQVDLTLPTTTIMGGPSGTVNSNDPTFTFTTNEPTGATFECSLDNAVLYTTCTSPKSYTDVADGSHTFYVRTRDRAGNIGLPATRTWTIDTAPPAPPTFTATDPASPAQSTSPKIKGLAETGSTVRLYTNATCSAGETGSVSAATFASTGVSVTVGANQTTTFYGKTTDVAGNVSVCSTASIQYRHDTVAPDTTIDSGPSSPVNSTSATFTFSSSESGSTFQCKVDAGSYSSCSSPHTRTGLSAGSRTFSVRAIDPAGNTDGTPATWTWTIDLSAPPAPTIGSPAQNAVLGSSNVTVSGTATASSTVKVKESGNIIGTTTADGSGNWTKTISFADGIHTIYATATDQANNESGAALGRTFTVDTVAPAAPTLTGTAPASPANNNSPKVVGSAEVLSTVTIYTNGTCTSAVAATGTAESLASPGLTVSVSDNTTTTFRAKATDAAGNASACSAGVTYVEDSAAPNTTITGGPSGIVGATSDPFTFTSTEPGSAFQCSVDGGTYTACTSPWPVLGLPDGNHTFNVRSIDQAGNTDATPASRTWTVDLTMPTVTGVSSPYVYPNGDGWRDTTTITATVADDRLPFTWTVRVPDTAQGKVTTGSSGALSVVWDGRDKDGLPLEDGTYTAMITAVDQVGNTRLTAVPVTLTRSTEVLGVRAAWKTVGPGRIPGGYTIGLNPIAWNLVITRQDVKVDAPGPDVVFSRTYNSQTTFVGAVGRGWRHSFEEDLAELGDNSVTYTDAEGDVHHYIRNPDLSYAHPPGVFDTLTKDPVTATFTLTRTPGWTKRFRADGRLSELIDPNGNRKVLVYNASSKLTSITDGATITYLTFGYTNGWLTSVTDQAGRTTVFVQSSGNLVAVSAPAAGVTSFDHDGQDRLSRITNARGDAWTIGYGTEGASSITAPTSVGGVWTVSSMGALVRRLDVPLRSEAAVFDMSGAVSSLSYHGGAESWTRNWDLQVTSAADRAGPTSSSVPYPHPARSSATRHQGRP